MGDYRQANWSGIFYSFLAGAAVGATLGLLFAPVSGKEAREAIANQFDELKEKLKKLEEKIRKGKSSDDEL